MKATDLRKLFLKTFSRIEGRKINQIKQLVKEFKSDPELKKFLNKYPDITFPLTHQDIKKIRELFKPNSEIPDANSTKKALTDPFAKILYALAWKDAKLKGLLHIIQGAEDCINKTKDQTGEAVVFYQFGRHLADQKCEPIVDQHSLRAFRLREFMEDQNEFETKLKELKKLKPTSQDVQDYKQWFCKCTKTFPSNSDRRIVDNLLFAIGKAAKMAT